METLVFNLNDKARPRECVRIDRPTLYGNPFVIGDRGMTRETVIVRYRLYLWNRMRLAPNFMKAIAKLADKPLACHCAPLACHGDVLVKAARWAAQHLAEQK